MPKYKAKVQFTFTGTVDVVADNIFLAREYIDKHFACVVRPGSIHTSLGDEIPDWDFPVHAEKKLKSIRRQYRA